MLSYKWSLFTTLVFINNIGCLKMAMFCKKCGGIIPDVMIGVNNDIERNDCKNHNKPEVNLPPYRKLK